MGTRSDIIVLRRDGKWHRIYCHWDGYLENNGKILFEHYTGQEKAEKLVALGDLSILGEVLGKKHNFDKRNSDGQNPKWKDWCLAYGRDRGEKDVSGTFGDKLFDVMPEETSWTEFTYIWCANPTTTEAQPIDQAKWWVGIPGESAQAFIDLGDALLGKKTLAAPVKLFGAVIGQHKPTAPGKDHSWAG